MPQLVVRSSNYLLYNYDERPEELWLRLELSIRLAEELNLDIYSFPMKYTPVRHGDGYHRNRDYLGPYWNRKFIRAVQSILNSTKGKISRKRDFFERAFGHNLDEFRRLLYMPENYILLRDDSEKLGLTDAWGELFKSLTNPQEETAFPIIHTNRFPPENLQGIDGKRITALLSHYTIGFDEIKDGSAVEAAACFTPRPLRPVAGSPLREGGKLSAALGPAGSA